MKKIWMLAGVCLLLSMGAANAQVRVSINIGSQPTWGPVGYDYVQYYYMPDIDAYYDVAAGQYIYPQGGRWMFASALPASYHYDVYRGYKVVVNEPKPYLHPEVYRARYANYRGQYGRQQIIRDSRDDRYRDNHARGDAYGRGYGRDHGNDHDHGRGHGQDDRDHRRD